MKNIKKLIAAYSLLDEQQHQQFTVLNEIRKNLEQVAPNLQEINLDNEIRIQTISNELAFNIIKNFGQQYKALLSVISRKYSRVTIRVDCKLETRNM